MLKINNNSALFDDITHYHSDNCDNRPKDIIIDTIIIHCISLPMGSYDNQNIVDLFTNNLDINQDPSFKSLKDVRVSSHLLIKRDGEIIQFVPFYLRAWHAGVSKHKERDNCNDYSIGIELEGTDKSKFTDVQYDRLNEIIRSLKDFYPKIVDENIIGHNEVSPDRKNDPGPYFEWNRIKV
jgi:AmpD protein